MAIATQGINGPFRGKVGSVIGYTLNGQQVMRSVGRRTRPFTELELLNQVKMKVTSEFLRRIKPFVKFGFRNEAPEGSRVGAFQLAQSYVRKHALELDAAGKPFVNPAKVLISKGPLEPPQNCTVVRDGNRLVFRWDYLNLGGNHRLLTLAYDGDSFRYFRDLGGERNKGEDEWDVPYLHLLERSLHVYAAFRNTITNEISDSVYCGAIDPASVPSVPSIGHSRPQTPPAPPIPPSGQYELTFPGQ